MTHFTRNQIWNQAHWHSHPHGTRGEPFSCQGDTFACPVPIRTLLAERDENELRKEFTPSERLAIADAVKERLGDRRGSNQYQTKEDVPNLPHAQPYIKTRDMAAKAAGFGCATNYIAAKKVAAKGSQELVEAMDDERVSIAAAAVLAD